MSGLLIKPGEREPLQSSFSDAANPVGLDGVEFIEYSTPKPQALGQVLEMMGFKPVARHRSREVMLYRQGAMNVVVNAHPADVTGATHGGEAPAIAAIALRVRDARAAYDYVLERGAWDVPTHAEVMELNIPAIHGVVRWRLKDLAWWVYEEFRISLDETTVGREVRKLGFRKLSARPRHHAQDPAALAAFKKTSPPCWRRSPRRRAASA